MKTPKSGQKRTSKFRISKTFLKLQHFLFERKKVQSVFLAPDFSNFATQVKSVLKNFGGPDFLIQVESVLTSKNFCRCLNFTPQIRLISHFFCRDFRETEVFVAFPNFQSQ
jgi:hypothetical protein